MRLTKYKLTIIMLALVMLFSLTAFFALKTVKPHAAGTVTVSGTNVFTSAGEANVIAHKEGEGDDAKYHTMFTFGYNDDTVSYRRNLAYKWYEQYTEGEGDDAVKKVRKGLFNMEIGFANLSFERFIITFESQQYNKSKDNKSQNYVIFVPAKEEGRVYATVSADKDAEVPEDKSIDAKRIQIKFFEDDANVVAGGYDVFVGNDADAIVGRLENVKGNYSKSSTSSTNPVYPLIFAADFGEDGEKEDSAKDSVKNAAQMVLYSLNGQAFEVTGANYDSNNQYYYGGTVADKKPPVLCLESSFNYFTLGDELDFDYAVIDVLRSSPSSTVHYYTLSYEQYASTEITDYNDKELFEEVGDDLRLETDYDKYLPDANEIYNEDLKADMLVKVYVTLTDVSSNSEKDDVYLDWYVPEEYRINVKDTDFIAVANDGLGVTFNYDGTGTDENAKTWEQLKAEYQAEVDEAAKDLSAGSSSYFYLPSPEKLFKDNADAYTNLRISIYYYHQSQQSNTNLVTSNLSINVSRQGAYTFTVYATDAAGNNMYYLEEVEEGKDYDKQIGDKYYKVVEFQGGDVWDMFNDKDELYDKLPWFNFNVSYTGVSFEETPGLQSTAYVGTSYSSATFKINGIADSYSTKYRLFIFDRAGYYNDKGKTFSYESFIGEMDGLFADADTRKYFKEIHSVTETDANYEEFKDYGWSGTSTTFTPQDANAFYYIRAEVTDTQYNTDPVTCGLAVVASVNAKELKGESDWLKNNIASVVLLIIAGLALIGIILLLVIKPKDKSDIDEQFEKRKKEKKNK